ncbi:hypothetical protein WICMUC_004836 [Wickerhamomyces mucosus]|uniref:Cell division control protein 25 n=1 Tax=Wickerhamomyces mucosus TaxID=1378264 RepID=A0A9P8T9J3_9ASCO|nr:hypothetical protein WICMUC_004836 [Wickerhamomyces mucosus]
MSTEESKLRPIDTLIVTTEFKTNKANLLNLYVGDIIYVFQKQDSGWWDGVIFTDNGTLRGWFPSTHTKSFSTNGSTSNLQSSNNSGENLAFSSNNNHNLNNNKNNNNNYNSQNNIKNNNNNRNLNVDSDNSQGYQTHSILKNNNLTTLLRSNLELQNKSRKNSSVSFASSEQSSNSTNKNNSTNANNDYQDDTITPLNTPTKNYEKQSVDPTSAVINIDSVKLVSATEVESIFTSVGSSNVPIWTPLATTNGSIVYYNSQLDIHCKELPYIETPEIDDTTKISIPPGDTDPKTFATVSLNTSHHDIGRQNIRNKSIQPILNSEGYGSHRGSIKSKSSLPSNSTTVHPWNSSLYCLPDLFYYDPTDLKTWSSLRDAFLYFVNLTDDALNKKVTPLFLTYFNIASRLGVLIHLAARLAQHDLQKSGHQKRVQNKLKKIASSIAQIGINGNLYLTEQQNTGSDRNLSTSTEDTLKIESNDVESLNSSNQIDYLQQVQLEMSHLKKSAISCVKIFIQISSNQLNGQAYLPQVYPRFLSGFFSGGNWRNPFVPDPKDPFEGKEIAHSLHHRRVANVNLNRETLEVLQYKKEELNQYLEDVLNTLATKKNSPSRNVEISSKIHKSLKVSTKYVDLIEGLDFSIFSNPARKNSLAVSYPNSDHHQHLDFDPSRLIYPVLTEFFESKQEIRDTFITIIMETQNLTLDDPTVFKSIKEDPLPSSDKLANVEPEKSAKLLELELNKIDIENDHGISINTDKVLGAAILKSFNLLEISMTLVQQLISEKESLLSYATRVMNDDFNYELLNNSHPNNQREDSTVTNDEYALPASTMNRHDLSKEVPWYLDSEEYNLIFSTNHTVKGGTREALIQRLTHHDLLDASFNLTFLLTFRSMMKTSTLMRLLIKRFNIEPPENLSYEEYTDWVEKKSYPIKLRVVNITKSLLLKYWVPNYNETDLPQIIGPFIDTLIDQKFPGSEQLSREYHKKVLGEDLKSTETSNQGIISNHKYDSKSAPSRIRKMKLLDIDANEFANQLTIKESALYSQITQTECLDKSWNNKYGSLGGFKNLQSFISNSNDLTNFVSTQIVTHNDVKKRVTIIKYFVNVAEKCRQLNNFSSMTAIISALYSSPIHRLRKTWNSVPQNILNSVSKLNDLMNSSRNFSEYREHLRFISDKPCVPFLGVFLSDLTFTSNGNPDHLHGDSKLVNFAKRSKTVDILREMSRYQSLKYNIKKNDEIQEFISYRLSVLLSIDEQYNRSLSIEPRVKVSQQLQNKANKSSIGSNATFKSKQIYNIPRFGAV